MPRKNGLGRVKTIMKKILISLSVIGVVSVIAVGATMAYFGDTETSTGNTMTAGTIDLKIDLQCPGNDCDWSLRDLNGESIFGRVCDIKPGDEGEVTLSWHVYDNNAWGRLRFANVVDYENGCSSSEAKVDNTCADPGQGQGELSQNLMFTLWMDEGAVAGWQCPDNSNGPCQADLLEGDNILNGVETIFAEKTMSQIISEGGVQLPGELEGSTTYYLGLKWSIPSETGNIIQTDSLVGKIIMEVVQSRNNPNPWTP